MLLMMLQTETWFENNVSAPPLDDVSDVPVDKNKMCQRLKNSKPSGCGDTAPPAPWVNTTLSVYAAQHANGCGAEDSGLMAALLVAAGGIFHPVFSGNLNKPWQGNPLDFTGTCNEHDACYAAAAPKPLCDVDFHQGLSGLCRDFAEGSESRNICDGFANAYAGAVQTSGQSAYNAALANMQCALWNKNMEQNGCPK